MLIASLPKYMMTSDITLRRVGVSDGPFLQKILTGEDIVKSSAAGRSSRTSWIFFYWWLRRTFFVAYRIEHKGEVIGFIGLFNLVPMESAEISLVLFNPALRRKGHGTQAVQMLSESPVLTTLANTLVAKVRKGNVSAHSFWAKLGFQTVRIEADVMVMIKKRLASVHHPADISHEPWQQ